MKQVPYFSLQLPGETGWRIKLESTRYFLSIVQLTSLFVKEIAEFSLH